MDLLAVDISDTSMIQRLAVGSPFEPQPAVDEVRASAMTIEKYLESHERGNWCERFFVMCDKHNTRDFVPLISSQKNLDQKLWSSANILLITKFD